ncbi:MAG: nickel-dependent hydrogenase large subunit, partial [Deltaproteobacteria bacterium]|nr:nickel-dependent hydrogenase large subunit [Deltaproteobacteria bacterium]
MTKKKNLVMAQANSYIAKIEGHGSLKVDFKKKKVKLIVHEGERLFEGILCGRTLEEMQWITPRICGVCPIAHNLASLAAAEAALGITVTRTTGLLRRLMQIGQNTQSHVLHAVFLALPDYIGIDNITELHKADPKKFALALSLKETGDEIAMVVAGRNVHPTRSTVGGFHKVPTRGELLTLRDMIERAVPDARALAEFFAGLDYPKLDLDLEFLLQDGMRVKSSHGEDFALADYKEYIAEEVRGESTAKFGSLKGRPIMVGSLARLFFVADAANGKTDKEGSADVAALIGKINFKNPFHNNLAQAVEMFMELKDGVEVIDELLKEGVDDKLIKADKDAPLKGIGAIEAPRGGLYNEVHIRKDGTIKYANIITPTVQNLTSIEYTATALLKEHHGKSEEELSHLLEMLVRAYDPC